MKSKIYNTLLILVLLMSISTVDAIAQSSGKLHYFSFCRGKNSDSVGQQTTGHEMFEMVKTAVIENYQPQEVNLLFDEVPYADNARVTVSTIRSELAKYRQTLSPQDTILIYSHSHGTPKGLLINKEIYSYEDLAKDVLSLPARNVIYLVLACHSGGFTDTLNREEFKSIWQNRTVGGM